MHTKCLFPPLENFFYCRVAMYTLAGSGHTYFATQYVDTSHAALKSKEEEEIIHWEQASTAIAGRKGQFKMRMKVVDLGAHTHAQDGFWQVLSVREILSTAYFVRDIAFGVAEKVTLSILCRFAEHNKKSWFGFAEEWTCINYLSRTLRHRSIAVN